MENNNKANTNDILFQLTALECNLIEIVEKVRAYRKSVDNNVILGKYDAARIRIIDTYIKTKINPEITSLNIFLDMVDRVTEIVEILNHE
jgi:hypothetical protein